jgi:MoaA/NifB/PqqE/SkfB family radical SAM enzyme
VGEVDPGFHELRRIDRGLALGHDQGSYLTKRDRRTNLIRPRHIRLGLRYAARIFLPLHPFEIQAQLWNTCDQRCLYCRCPRVQTELMSTEDWRTILRALGKWGTLRLKFQGGEPTLRPDFRELSHEAKKAGMRTAAVSHGIRIASDPGLLDYLDELVISLDSVRPDVNDRLRGDGAHRGATRAISLALERKLSTYVNMAVCQINLSDLEPMLEFCESRGISMNAQPIVFGRVYYDSEAKALGLEPEQVRALHRQLARWKKQGRNLLFSPRAYLKAVGWADLTELTTRSAGRSPCRAGKDYFHVEPNGDVLPCIQHGAAFSPKNILHDGLEEALGHARNHDCGDCWPAYLNERKLLFRLNPGAVREMMRRN